MSDLKRTIFQDCYSLAGTLQSSTILLGEALHKLHWGEDLDFAMPLDIESTDIVVDRVRILKESLPMASSDTISPLRCLNIITKRFGMDPSDTDNGQLWYAIAAEIAVNSVAGRYVPERLAPALHQDLMGPMLESAEDRLQVLECVENGTDGELFEIRWPMSPYNTTLKTPLLKDIREFCTSLGVVDSQDYLDVRHLAEHWPGFIEPALMLPDGAFRHGLVNALDHGHDLDWRRCLATVRKLTQLYIALMLLEFPIGIALNPRVYSVKQFLSDELSKLELVPSDWLRVRGQRWYAY